VEHQVLRIAGRCRADEAHRLIVQVADARRAGDAPIRV
jgi:hypothetical protein